MNHLRISSAATQYIRSLARKASAAQISASHDIVSARRRLEARATLGDGELHRDHRLAASPMGRTDGAGAERIEPDGDTHIAFIGTDAVCGIEADPAQPRHEALGPAMHRVVPPSVSSSR